MMTVRDYFAKIDATIPALKEAKTPDEVPRVQPLPGEPDPS